MKTKIEIIFEDDALLVVNKPPGITVIPDRIHTGRETVQRILEKDFGKLFVLHRLDRNTSGVLCFARNAEAHRNLSLQFQNHQVKKIYSAVVRERMASKSGTIDAPIAEHPSIPGTMIVGRKGKEALSLYEVMEEFKHCTLVKVEIKTGRTHQIRVHMASIGNPLLVDEAYGGTESFYLSSIKKKYKHTSEEERSLITRQPLHASEISFTHPVSGEPVSYSAPLSADMATLLKILRKYDAI